LFNFTEETKRGKGSTKKFDKRNKNLVNKINKQEKWDKTVLKMSASLSRQNGDLRFQCIQTKIECLRQKYNKSLGFLAGKVEVGARIRGTTGSLRAFSTSL
jgi:hypothetical protein